MYKIIGADGREYGPVSLDQLQRWFTEGRVNAQTMVKGEGLADWVALGSVSEVASRFNAPPTILPPPNAYATRASNKIAAGVLAIVLGSLGIHKFILGYTAAGLIMLLVTVLTCGWGGIIMHSFGIIEGVLYLTKTDEDFVRTYVDQRKEWF